MNTLDGKFSESAIQALMQHAGYSKHKKYQISDFPLLLALLMLNPILAVMQQLKFMTQ